MLYVGVDIGKHTHHAAFLSRELLAKYLRYEKCPVYSVENSRASFDKLLNLMHRHAPSEQCCVLFERTGHYGNALEQYLRESGVILYRINAQERYGRDKTDKRDAQALSVILYNQVELHSHVTDKHDVVHPLIPPSPTAVLLRALVQHRSELVRETTRRKNKLTAIADELFPELSTIYNNVNSASALQLRTKYPTPQAVADTTVENLLATQVRVFPGRKKQLQLQELARNTIGTKDENRRKSLLIEQAQLITELKLLDSHIEQLNSEIEKALSSSREGQILLSFPIIGPTQAAILLSNIGTIANFETVGHLRAYMGWAPQQSQTGISYDRSRLGKGGNNILKETMLLIVWGAIRRSGKWQNLYNRLLPLKCEWDPKKQEWKGRMRVIGRIAGQIIRVIYTLLSRDYQLIAEAVGEPPLPELYAEKRESTHQDATASEQGDDERDS